MGPEQLAAVKGQNAGSFGGSHCLSAGPRQVGILDQDGRSIKSLFNNRECRKLPSLIRTYSQGYVYTSVPICTGIGKERADCEGFCTRTDSDPS